MSTNHLNITRAELIEGNTQVVVEAEAETTKGKTEVTITGVREGKTFKVTVAVTGDGPRQGGSDRRSQGVHPGDFGPTAGTTVMNYPNNSVTFDIPRAATMVQVYNAHTGETKDFPPFSPLP